MKNIRLSSLVVAGLLLCGMSNARSPDPARLTFNIQAQRLDTALTEFAQATGLQLLFPTEVAMDQKSPAIAGSLTAEAALQLLLKGSGLSYRYVNAKTVAITSTKETSVASGKSSSAARLSTQEWRVARNESAQSMQAVAGSSSAAPEGQQSTQGIPEMLVKGSRSLNSDIRRTEDSPQPYVIFDSEDLRRAQSVNLEEFLMSRLPMNTASSGRYQTFGSSATNSTINLRGLGTNQTLILVDGRRLPGVSQAGGISQPDINGIPLAAIDRVEILPSTAGGIHGGSATGGVVNIILRRDFNGVEARGTYANTFDTDAGNRRLDLNAGFNLEDGRTQIVLAASRSEANNLTIGDRDFAARAIALQLQNNPNAILGATSPPLGGTVNIRSVSGNLVLDNGTPVGSNITHVPLGYSGVSSDNGAGLVRNAGRYNLDLPAGLAGRDRGLAAAPTMESFSMNLRREFGSRMEAFLDVSSLGNHGSSFNAGVPSTVTTLPAGAPTNPFRQDIRVSFPTTGLRFESRSESNSLRATGGIILRLPYRWTGEFDYAWNRSRFQTVSTGSVVDSAASTSLRTGLPAPDGRPRLDALQEGNTYPIDFTPYLLPSPNLFSGPYDTTLKDATLRLSGPTVNLPAGAVNLIALFQRRQEELQDAYQQNIDTSTRAPTYLFYPHRSQDATSFYLEASAPLLRKLDLQASVRHDRYATHSDGLSGYPLFGGLDGPYPVLTYGTNRLQSTDYTLGLKFTPTPDLMLRASVGTGFLPPSIGQITPRVLPETSGSLGIDRKRGDTSTDVGEFFTYIVGGNPLLKPERSTSWSAGAVFTPRPVPGLRLSLDYTRIRKIDEIQTPNSQFLLDREDDFPGRILRGDNLDTDDDDWLGPIISFDGSSINIATTEVEALDLQADYTVDTSGSGTFHWYAIATWQPHYTNQLLPVLAAVDTAGFTGGPLKRRGNLGFDYDRGPFTVNWNAQYYHSYFAYTATGGAGAIATARLNQGSTIIPSQIYHDLNFSYRFDGARARWAGWLADSDISFGIQNLFDRSPPILAATSLTAGSYSTYGDPRLRRYTVSLRKRFD